MCTCSVPFLVLGSISFFFLFLCHLPLFLMYIYCTCRLKLHDLFDMKGVYNMVNIDEDKGAVSELQWTDDGQLLTLSTNNGVYRHSLIVVYKY